jgi:hypothetical protein
VLKMHRFFFALTTALIGLFFIAMGSDAKADLLSSISLGQLNLFTDTDADIGVTTNANGQYVEATGALEMGDFLVSAINFDKVNGNVVTGVNGFTILQIASAPTFNSTVNGVSLYNFTFSAPSVTIWDNIVSALFPGDTALDKTTSGGAVSIYQATADFNPMGPSGQTLAQSAAVVYTGGSKVFEFGFGSVGATWTAVGPDQPSLGSGTTYGNGISGTAFNFALSVLEGPSDWTYIPLTSSFFGGTAQVVGGGSLYGYGGITGGAPVGPWQIGSGAQYDIAPIPEPTSIVAMLGMAVAGLGIGMRRMRSRARK